jgi:hypothetical protein
MSQHCTVSNPGYTHGLTRLTFLFPRQGEEVAAMTKAAMGGTTSFREALDNRLMDATWSNYIDKKQLLIMYVEAKTILCHPTPNRKLNAMAKSLFDTSVRVARCLAIEAPEAKVTLSKGREIELDALVLYAQAEKELKQLHLIAFQKR